MGLITKPMLAAKDPVIEQLTWPQLITDKLDGIRALRIGDSLVSRTFKPIANDHIRETCARLYPEGFDGEVMVVLRRGLQGEIEEFGNFQACTSGVMDRKRQGIPDFCYMVFDWVQDSLAASAVQRAVSMRDWYESATEEQRRNCRMVLPTVVHSPAELFAYEEAALERGNEGAMIRIPSGPYKCGRATLKEGYLSKVVRWETAEGTVTGFVEQLENTNEATQDAFGRTKRSSKKEGKVGKDTLGKLILRLEDGRELRVGTGKGLTHQLRDEIWGNQSEYLNKIVKFKFKPHGTKDLPRIPIFEGFRSPEDL